MATDLPPRIIRKPELLTLIPISHSSLDRRIRAGLFPPPVSLGGRAVGWPAREINDYLNLLYANASDEELREAVQAMVLDRGSNASENQHLTSSLMKSRCTT